MRRFDGPTLEEALHTVILAVGPDARIINAETVRSGGIGGFFAKEHVELTVEIDDDFDTKTTQLSDLVSDFANEQLADEYGNNDKLILKNQVSKTLDFESMLDAQARLVHDDVELRHLPKRAKEVDLPAVATHDILKSQDHSGNDIAQVDLAPINAAIYDDTNTQQIIDSNDNSNDANNNDSYRYLDASAFERSLTDVEVANLQNHVSKHASEGNNRVSNALVASEKSSNSLMDLVEQLNREDEIEAASAVASVTSRPIHVESLLISDPLDVRTQNDQFDARTQNNQLDARAQNRTLRKRLDQQQSSVPSPQQDATSHPLHSSAPRPVKQTTPPAVSTESRSFADVLNSIAAHTGALPQTPAQSPIEVRMNKSNGFIDLSDDELSNDNFESDSSINSSYSGGSIMPATTAMNSSHPNIKTSIAVRESMTPELFQVHNSLRLLGVPEQYLPKETSLGDIYNRLVSTFHHLPHPAALPTGDGSVIAVAGWRKAAIATAHELSIRLGLDPADMVLASSHGDQLPTSRDRTICSAQQADEQRRSWRWRAHPTIVAVDAPLGTRDVDWARNVMRAIAPNAAWGVVDATRKTDDVADWSATLGGLDAFALVGASVTRTPAAILELGVSVAMIDGEIATPDRWATLLAGRLAA